MEKIPNLSAKERVILNLLITNGEMYGLEMVEASKELKRGTVYVTLGRMADKGFVDSTTRSAGSTGPPRRLYRATGLGQRVLDAWELARASFAGMEVVS